jgi:hypothetical protein
MPKPINIQYSYAHVEFSNDLLMNAELYSGNVMPTYGQPDSQKRVLAPTSNSVWKKRGLYMTCEMNPEFASFLSLIIN